MRPNLSVWKFEFSVNDDVILTMPEGAIIVAVGTQNPNKICLWAIVDPEADTEPRRFYVRGTGHPFPASLADKYVGTAFDGPFVWHVFGGE